VQFAAIEADGFLLGWPGEKNCRIVVRLGCEAGRRNFTIAHEIGHYVLREQLNGAVPRTLFEQGSRDEETLCNSFAAELLMPATLVFAGLRESGMAGLSAPALLRLAAEYEVSVTALLARVAGAMNGSFLGLIWSGTTGRCDVSWATNGRFARAVLCDTGESSVERALCSGKEERAEDQFLVQGTRTRWMCSSYRLGAKKVLTIAVKQAAVKRWFEDQWEVPTCVAPRSIRQLELPFVDPDG
jgi:hypothetical protein